VAEQLAEAVLKISYDATALTAGLQQTQREAEQAGRAIDASFSKPGRLVDTTAINVGLRKVEEQAQQTGKSVEQALNSQAPPAATRSIQALQSKLQGLRESYSSVEIGSKEFRKLQAEIQRTEKELANVDKTLGNTFRERASGFGSGLLGALGIGLGIGAGAAIGGFIKESIDQATQLETITRKLQNTLGAQGAGGALSFTGGLAKDLGLNFKTLAESFSSFTAAATAANVPLETQKGLFAAVSKAGQSLGLSNDEINGSFLALQQVASKGTVQMEELRGQLGERLPIALTATAKGLGLTQQELIKLVESGKLTADQFFPALTKGLNELTSGSGGIETAQQTFQKFSNAWQELQVSFGTNLLPAVTASVKLLTQALEGFGVATEASGLRDNFGFNQVDSTQLVGTLRNIRKEYNLTAQQVRNIVSQSIANSGAKKNLFGELGFDDKQYARFQSALFDNARRFRERNPDQQAAVQAAAAAEQKRKQAEIAAAEIRNKQLDISLTQNKADLELRSLQDRLDGARKLAALDDLARAKQENRLALSEKLRATEALRLDLAREEAKPKGIGDGKNGTQSTARLTDLQNQIRKGEAETALLRVQQATTEANALRTQQDRYRGYQLENAAAADKLAITQEQTRLEQQAGERGGQVSASAQLELQLRQQIAAALRQQAAAQQALQAETRKPAGQQDRMQLETLFRNVYKANADVRQAYAEAGQKLVDNLNTAKATLQGLLRGNYDVLTPRLQQEQLTRARASLQPLVDNGTIRAGLDISTPDKLFRLAGIAEQLGPAQENYRKALELNTGAIQGLAGKDWNVYVSAPGQATPIPLPVV
jgi:tape measure domain-containing protein